MSRLPKIALTALLAAVASSSLVSAATVSVAAPADEGVATKIAEGRLRWGATGFEVGAGKTVGTAGQFSSLDYSGTSWSNSVFTFSLGWNAALGRVTLSTSRGAGTASFDIASEIGKGPQDIYIRLGANATQTVTLTDLKVNGSAVNGSIPNLVSTAANTTNYYKLSGVGGTGFTSLTGSFSFTGTGNFSQERPIINFKLSNPSTSDLSQGGTPIPLPSAALAGGMALATGLTRRTRRA